jgi:hypothetical protein
MGQNKDEEVEATFFGMDRKILKGIGISILFVVGGLITLSIIQDIRNKNINS